MKVTYTCSGCRCALEFRAFSRRNKLAVQVAFITAGCTYATYVKALQHVLGIRPVRTHTFMRTIETLHPIVEQMVDEMCECEKQRMRRIDPSILGSWKKAVTCADGTWHIRGYHSKNATFSIRNYSTGALLYYKHICQRGRDNLIDEELYKGTSKSAEGYSAKQEGLNIAIHWQDADSSSSKSVLEISPGANVMICGGHAGRAHLKQLQSLAKKKNFSDKFPCIPLAGRTQMGRRTCTHSVQLWQLHGQERATMPRQRLPHKGSVELPLPLVGVQNRVSHQG